MSLRRAQERHKEYKQSQTYLDKNGTAANNEASHLGVYAFGLAVFVVVAAVLLIVTRQRQSIVSVSVCLLAAAFVALSVRICPQWERVAILRFGRFSRIAGPGLFFVIPIVEYVAIRVDQRVIASAFTAEQALTADLVPVDVDAVLFWLVWDAKCACLEVRNYPKAVMWSAQTALRDAIGQVNLDSLSRKRKQIDREIQEVLGDKCADWGIAIASVEIRDIAIPQDLQNALSQEAQAVKERDARLILAETEREIAESYLAAAEVYGEPDKALQLRAMNLARESSKDSRGFVLAPTSLADAFDLEHFAQ